MAASRGDTKPCTVPNCSGTMQYGRRNGRDARVRRAQPDDARTLERVSDRDDVRGWRCSAARSHFRER